VIGWCEEFPDDWKRTWFETEKKWSSDVGCPDGVFDAFNIDAKINAAYIVIGMLYGDGDFGKTVDISTRCGQDSDCNPASAGGILGAMIGYDQIPEFWKQGLDRVEDMDFKYTTISLNDVYEMGYGQALQVVKENGGKEEPELVTIPLQKPEAVKYEKAFEGHFPNQLIHVPWESGTLKKGGNTEYEFFFNGKGFVIRGAALKESGTAEEKTLRVDLFVDDVWIEEIKLPTLRRARRHDIAWKYRLENGDHRVKIQLKSPPDGYKVEINKVFTYGPEPA
jgi:hypothetical protein